MGRGVQISNFGAPQSVDVRQQVQVRSQKQKQQDPLERFRKAFALAVPLGTLPLKLCGSVLLETVESPPMSPKTLYVDRQGKNFSEPGSTHLYLLFHTFTA